MISSPPTVYLTSPTFGFVPEPLPQSLPPPVNEHSFRSPFGINASLYNAVLRPEIPITFALLYVVAVLSLNAYNNKRNNKPWWISRQPFFTWFVVIHNALLTIFSVATCLAMYRAITHTWPSWSDGNGAAGVADALCKMHGPRGLGDAATYNTTINIWEVKNTMIKLAYDGTPHPTDVGRLWNEGLAFWGWMFYVSKFYEVLDTLIILSKGKRSATLQTYHHSGAMLCMWAGIRYMSPPIWMFVFVNSFIHALMYTYFTLSAVGVRVPIKMKQTLTVMQIGQFIWGASYAAAHLFVKYDIPVSTPYQVASVVKEAASSVSSVATKATSVVSSVIESPVATGTMVAFIKKMLLRAVGEEGIAERVTADYGSFAQQHLPPTIEEKLEKVKAWTQPQYETKWRTEYTQVNCIDTSGEAFAIYLNLLYLAPLTYLFARFFINVYLRHGKPRSTSHAAKQIKQSGKVAAERTEETVENLGKQGEEIIAKEAQRAKLSTQEIHEQLRKDVQAMKNGTWGRDRRVSDHVQVFENQVRDAAERAKEEGRKLIGGTRSPRRLSPSKRTLGVPRSNSSQSLSGSAIEDEPQSAKSEKGGSSAALDAIKFPQTTSGAEAKQEDILASTETTRPGASTEGSTSDLPSGFSSEVIQESTSSFASSSEQQGSSMTASSFTDTDAMGKSGVDVEFAPAAGDDGGQRDFGGERDFPLKLTEPPEGEEKTT